MIIDYLCISNYTLESMIIDYLCISNYTLESVSALVKLRYMLLTQDSSW